MSFILDALKKSENERQRQVGPSLADVQFRRARTDRPWWAVAVAALLVVNLGVLVIVLTRDEDKAEGPAQSAVQIQAPQPQPIATQPRPQTAPYEAAMPPPARTNPAVHSLAEAAGADVGEAGIFSSDPAIDPAIAAAAAVPDGPPIVRPITPPTVAPSANQPTFAARERGNGGTAEEMLPTHNSLVAGGTSLPDMRLDIHVYSATPRERFVFVNMHKYAEGQVTTEGPTIERITPDGAILNQHGMRFLLPRQ